MTFLSSAKSRSSTKKATASIIALSIVSASALFSSTNALATSCSKSDIDYYLQRGFSNAQVVQLCAGPAAVQNTSQQTYQAPVQNQQNNQLREDQSYLSAALDSDIVTMTSQKLTLSPLECIEYGSGNVRAGADLMETICVNTKLTIDFTGMTIGKSSKGFFLVKDASIEVKGKIRREFTGISALRRQDQQSIRETLSENPKTVKIKIRRGIDPFAVTTRLSKYAK